MNIYLVALAAFLGSVAATLKSWVWLKQPFDLRQFIGSVITSLFSAVTVAVATDLSHANSGLMYLIAFGTGAGIGSAGKPAVGAVAARMKARAIRKRMERINNSLR